MNVENRIGRYIVEEALQGDRTDFDHDTDLISIAAIDSLSIIDLISFLEETFGIDIGPAELSPANLKSVNAMASMVRRLSL